VAHGLRVEVAGGRAAVMHAGPASGHRLETLHMSGRCMCGAWKSGGSWQRSVGTANTAVAIAIGALPNARGARLV
jgi:hypothetical protein